MRFDDVPLHSPGFHMVSGMPGSGKGVLDACIADRLHDQTGKTVYLSMLEGRKKPKLPDHVKTIEGVDFPLDCIAVLMDAQLQAHARRFLTGPNVLLDQMHAELRHDNIDYIFDTQTFAGIDRNNILRSNYRWYKKPYGKEVEMGRSEVKDEVAAAHDLFLDKELRYVWTHAYLFADTLTWEWEGMVTGVRKPEWYTDDISRMHRRRPKGWRRLIPT